MNSLPIFTFTRHKAFHWGHKFHYFLYSLEFVFLAPLLSCFTASMEYEVWSMENVNSVLTCEVKLDWTLFDGMLNFSLHQSCQQMEDKIPVTIEAE